MFVVFFSNIHWGCPSPTFLIYEECTLYIHIIFTIIYIYVHIYIYMCICIYLLYICVIYIYIYRCRHPWHPRKISGQPGELWPWSRADAFEISLPWCLGCNPPRQGSLEELKTPCKVVPQLGIAKLVHITPIKPMVYGTYNYSFHGGYKPTYNWAPSCGYEKHL